MLSQTDADRLYYNLIGKVRHLVQAINVQVGGCLDGFQNMVEIDCMIM